MGDRFVTRRQLLARSGRVLAGAAGTAPLLRAAGAMADAAGARAPSTQPTTTRAATRPMGRPRRKGLSRVVQVEAPEIFRGYLVRQDLLRAMIERAVSVLVDERLAGAAWHRIFRDDDVIGIKFNSNGARELETTATFASVLVRSLVEAGWKPERIVLIEAPRSLEESLGTTPATAEWSPTVVDFGSGRDRFAAVLDRITALINVPFLKTHNIAGMTGCLKNLSHALVRSPGRYHGNACSPYIADIVAAEPIRSKLRLNLVNALRAVFDKGPQPTATTIWQARSVVAAIDPVAADTVGLELLNGERHLRGLASLDDDDHPIPHLYDAHHRGLGTASWEQIEYLPFEM